jgi:hypothetical protein
MKQTIAAVLMAVLAGVAACSGARGSGQGRERTAAAFTPHAGRGAVASPWLDDPDLHSNAAGEDSAPVVEDSESSEEESDDFGDGGGEDSGEGSEDGGEDASEPEIDLEEGWGGDEDWDEEEPGDE